MGELLRRRALMIAPGGNEQWVPTDDHIYSSYYIRQGNAVRSGDVFTFRTIANSWNSYITAQPALYKVKALSGRFRLRGHLVCASGVRFFASIVCTASSSLNHNRNFFKDVSIVEESSGGYSGNINVETTIDMSNWNQEDYVSARWWAYSSTAIANAAVLTAPVMEAILL